MLDAYELRDHFFADFDKHICSLLGTPMLKAGLAQGSAEICSEALGMGAVAEVRELASVREELGVSLAAKVATRDGQCSLAVVFARAGRVEALRYALNNGADFAAKDDNGATALHYAAAG